MKLGGTVRGHEKLKPSAPQRDITITGAAWLLVCRSVIQDQSRAQIPKQGA